MTHFPELTSIFGSSLPNELYLDLMVLHCEIHTSTLALPQPPFFCFSFFFFFFFRAKALAYGRSQARSGIRSVASSLHHSHSKAGFELGLWATPQLPAMLDIYPNKWVRVQGLNPSPHGHLWGLLPLSHDRHSLLHTFYAAFIHRSFYWPKIRIYLFQT